MAAPRTPDFGFGEFLKETASRDPVGRLVTTVHRLGPNVRMSEAAKWLNLPDDNFSAAVAEAEWGGLLKREQRSDGFYLILTPQGAARAEAILS